MDGGISRTMALVLQLGPQIDTGAGVRANSRASGAHHVHNIRRTKTLYEELLKPASLVHLWLT